MGELVAVNQKTNLADYFRSDCTIVLPNGKTVTSEYLKTLKNFYKEQLYTKLNGKTVGKTVYIGGNNFDVIVPALQAIWELGANITVQEFPYDFLDQPVFQGFFNNIDAIIASPALDNVLPHVPHIPALETQMSLMDYKYGRGEQEIYQLKAEDYPDKQYELDQPIGPETICTVAYSQGSYGDMDRCVLDHATAIKLVHEQIRLNNFTEHDRVLHHKTLHHGALFLNYAVPALITTPTHYWSIQQRNQNATSHLESCLRLCQEQKLTKYLVPFRDIKLLADSQVSDIHLPNTDLFTIIGASSAEMSKIFDRFGIKSVYNNFGCTEVGTVAIKITTCDNLDSYSPTQFDQFNTLLDLKQESDHFLVKFKHHNKWSKIGDIVEISDNCFTWQQRNSKFNRFDINQLTNYIQQVLKTSDFFLIPDYYNNKLYLPVFNSVVNISLDEVNQKLEEKFPGCRINKIHQFVLNTTSRPNLPMILYAFRKNIT